MPMKKESRIKKYQSLRDSGICPSCRKAWNGPQVMCDDCRRKNEERRKKRRKEREEHGVCTRCGKFPAIKGTKYCETCARKAKKHTDSKETTEKRLKKYHEVYKPILQARRIEYKAKGLCADCGKVKAVQGLVCEDCYAKRREVYERFKKKYVASQASCRCDGDCANCRLPWCFNDDYDIVLTEEEKKRSRELDKEATADVRRWKTDNTRDKKNARNRIHHNEGVIAQLEYIEECERPLTVQEKRRLALARQHLQESKYTLKKLEDEVYE